jgi:hypothetical protein
MKTFNELIEEIMESVPINSMGGGFSNASVGSNQNPYLAGVHPVIGGEIRKRKKKVIESFAGCPVFTVSSNEYAKCMHGRMRYERWNKKLNMEDFNNQEIKTYSYRNPGKPIIVKDSTYGTMSYFIPPTKKDEENKQ